LNFSKDEYKLVEIVTDHFHIEPVKYCFGAFPMKETTGETPIIDPTLVDDASSAEAATAAVAASLLPVETTEQKGKMLLNSVISHNPNVITYRNNEALSQQTNATTTKMNTYALSVEEESSFRPLATSSQLIHNNLMCAFSRKWTRKF
jgi:hypothetical protein